MTEYIDHEPIHELDYDGEIGNNMGYHLFGHVDHDTVEAFMAFIEQEYGYPEWSPVGGWDVEHTYVRKVPIRDGGGSRYVYTGTPARGAYAVTKIERYSFWMHWCHNHPLDGATTGILEANVSDAAASGTGGMYW